MEAGGSGGSLRAHRMHSQPATVEGHRQQATAHPAPGSLEGSGGALQSLHGRNRRGRAGQEVTVIAKEAAAPEASHMLLPNVQAHRQPPATASAGWQAIFAAQLGTEGSLGQSPMVDLRQPHSQTDQALEPCR